MAAQKDTKIILGTGRMLAIFFAFVLVCAFFFAIGFSFGRKTAMAGGRGLLSAEGATPAAIVRPSAAKNDAHPAEPQSGDFSFYKAVGEKNANPTLAPPDAKPQPPSATVASAVDAVQAAPDMPAAAPGTGGYFVQVAAVTRKEDAEALVEALKKKQYPAFSANNPPSDKFYHVQVGPYPEMKDAEAMRARLIGDGYNPIVKK